jgi:hypothetical protein
MLRKPRKDEKYPKSSAELVVGCPGMKFAYLRQALCVDLGALGYVSSLSFYLVAKRRFGTLFDPSTLAFEQLQPRMKRQDQVTDKGHRSRVCLLYLISSYG